MTSPAGKLLVALQYCANDAIEAFDLVNLILDLRHNTMTEPCWELLFYRSPDAPDPPADLQLRLDHQGIVWASASSGVTVNGWPMGPNATWQSLVHLLVGNPVIHPECRHVLCAEPDSSPMRRDWAEALFAEHLLGVEQGLVFSGHKKTTAVGTSPHVNGNLIFDRKGLDKLPTELYLEMLKETEVPWDVEFSDIIVPRAYDNRMLHSSWRGEMQDSAYAWELDKFAGPCAWLHGFKGKNLRSEVRRRLLQPCNKMCRNITIYCKDTSDTKESLLPMFSDTVLIYGDYIEAIKEWSERGGLLIKSPAQDMEDFMHGITDALYRLKWPRFMCARHPDNLPPHLKFCDLADTTVLYTVPGNELARKLAAECVTEAQVAQMIANDPAVTWAPQGLWEAQDLPEPEIPRYLVLQHKASGWTITKQTDDRYEAMKVGGRSRWRGKTMLLDTLQHRAQQLHMMPEVGDNKMKIYTYDAPVPGMTTGPLIELWKARWSAQGWEPVVLGPEDAKAHPLYAELLPRFMALPTVNAPEYELACYLRWLAVAQAGGGWMSDADVIPYDFKPKAPPVGLRIWSTGNPCPCLVSGTRQDFELIAKALGAWEGQTNLERGLPHASDQNILGHLPNLFTQMHKCSQFGETDWDRKPVVHYCNGSMTKHPDRANAIPTLR